MRQSDKATSRSVQERGIHYAWFIAAIAAVLQVTTNFISQAFSVIMVTIQKDFGWTLTAITVAYFLKNIVQAAFSPIAGWLGDRYGARRALLLAATVYAVGLFLLSQMHQIWQLYLYYSVMLGLAQGVFAVNIPTTVAAWFRQRLGVAIGVQQSLGGMGASIMAPLLALVLARTDWQSAFIGITLIGGIILFTLLFLFHNDPADHGMRPYGALANEPSQPSVTYNLEITKIRAQVFMQHVRRTWAFWNLIAIHYLGCIGHSIIMVGVVYFATTRGVSLPHAAWIVSIYSLCGVASRFATPILADRWGAKGFMGLAFFIQGITVALLFWAHELWQFYVFAALFGIGLGGEMSAFIVINRQYYGVGPVRTVFGFQQFGSSLGMALGGLIGSMIFDRFGSYDIAWLVSIAASLGGVICILLLEPTSQLLIPDWEESLPPEARSSASTGLA
jgi:MFS family permease